MNVLFRTIKETFAACPAYAVSMAFVLIALGFMPSLNLYLTAEIISMFEHPQTKGNIGSLLALWGGALLAPVLISPLIAFIQSNINIHLSKQITSKLMNKSMSFFGLSVFENQNFRNTVNTLNKETKYRPTNFSVSFVTLLKEITVVITLAFMLGSFIWWAPIIMLLAAVPLAWINIKVSKYSWDALVGVGEDSRKLDYLFALTLDKNITKDIKMFDADNLIMHKHNKSFFVIQKALFSSSVKILSQPIPYQIGMVLLLSFILYSLYEGIGSTTFDISSIVIILQSLVIMNGRLETIAQYCNVMTGIMPYFKKFFDFIDYEEDVQNGDLPIGEIVKVEFKEVYFKYPGDTDFTLKNISFSAEQGESIALVGHNGAGKSTLTNLICRFWDVTEGEILINGVNIKKYDITMLRKCIGIVQQSYSRFNFSLGENISFKTENKDISSISETLGFSAELTPDTLLGKEFGGVELSGGNWQKVSIARCLHKSSSLVLLDEPTSAIDPSAELDLYHMFKTLGQNKISFIITHRMGAVAFANRVIVLSNGMLDEDSTPKELLDGKSKFHSMWRSQADLYKQMESEQNCNL